eukprot:1323800-Amorphochlora_amoeboformis.AAC.1
MMTATEARRGFTARISNYLHFRAEGFGWWLEQSYGEGQEEECIQDGGYGGGGEEGYEDTERLLGGSDGGRSQKDMTTNV